MGPVDGPMPGTPHFRLRVRLAVFVVPFADAEIVTVPFPADDDVDTVNVAVD
jgi:hypothetical protein